MRLLFVIENSFYGGGERSFSSLIRGLKGQGLDLHVASARREPFFGEVSPYAATHEFGTGGLISPFSVFRLASLIKDIAPDIVHSQGARMDFYCALACRIAGVEHVSTVAMPVEGFDVGVMRKAAYRFFGGIGELFTSRFVTVSGALKKDLSDGHGIAPARITVIPNCAGPDFFTPPAGEESLAEAFGLSGKVVIGAFGRLVWQKGFDVLLNAFAGLRRSRPDLKLLIAGTGALEGELRKTSDSLGITDDVIWTGFRRDIPRLLSLCDVFALPSLREGQPIALIEAMAMGLPIVASSIPGTLETAVDGKEALLVAPGDAAALERALRALLEDADLARRLGEAARKRASIEFTEAVFIKRHAEFYGKN